MTLLASALVTLVLICLLFLRRRLEFLMTRDDTDPRMDSVNDRRSILCDHTSNTTGFLLAVAVIMIGIHTFSPHP